MMGIIKIIFAWFGLVLIKQTEYDILKNDLGKTKNDNWTLNHFAFMFLLDDDKREKIKAEINYNYSADGFDFIRSKIITSVKSNIVKIPVQIEPIAAYWFNENETPIALDKELTQKNYSIIKLEPLKQSNDILCGYCKQSNVLAIRISNY